MDKSDIVIRLAKPEDLHDLIKIGDVKVGKDNFQSSYLQNLDDPDCCAMVADVKGQSVSFMSSHLLDGGMSCIFRFARTLSSCRKQDMMQKVFVQLTIRSFKQWPNIQYVYSCLKSMVPENASKNLLSNGFVEILPKPVFSFVYNLKDLKNMECQDRQLNVIELSYDDIKTLFTLDDVTEKLFPMKRLFNNCIGYRCLESNIKHMLGGKKEVCITTRTPQPPQPGVTLSMLNDVDVITFTEWWMAEAGLVYVVDAYAISNRNGTSLPAHLLRHLKKIEYMNHSDKGVFVVSLVNLPEDELKSLLQHHGIAENLPGSEQRIALFEKRINPRTIFTAQSGLKY